MWLNGALSEQARHRQGHDGLLVGEGHPLRHGLRGCGAGEAWAQVPSGAAAVEGPTVSAAALLSPGDIRG